MRHAVMQRDGFGELAVGHHVENRRKGLPLDHRPIIFHATKHRWFDPETRAGAHLAATDQFRSGGLRFLDGATIRSDGRGID